MMVELYFVDIKLAESFDEKHAWKQEEKCTAKKNMRKHVNGKYIHMQWVLIDRTVE